jgi:uncharacterized oligopeptide transporter (OPT) family protein
VAEPDRELSGRAIGFGVVVGALLAAANVYAGLKLGDVDAGTTPIVLLAFACSARARGGSARSVEHTANTPATSAPSTSQSDVTAI